MCHFMKRSSYEKMKKYEDLHWWYKARRKILQKVLNSHFKNKKTASILEIGCGSGGNLQLLSFFGKTCAMEMDESAIESAQERKICEIRKGSLPNDIPFTEKFDLVCLFDVIEHIDDDQAALKQALNLLVPGGSLLITVPAYMFLWSSHDQALGHKRRYTRMNLMDTVRKTGIKIQFSSYFNTMLFPCIALVRFFNKFLGNKKEDDLSMPPNIVNDTLYGIMSLESFILPCLSMPFGVSIVLLAQKSHDPENNTAAKN